MKNCDKWSVAGTTATSNNNNSTTLTESEKIGNLVAHAAASINQGGDDQSKSTVVAAVTESSTMSKSKDDDGDDEIATSVENCVNVNKDNGNSDATAVNTNDSTVEGVGEKKKVLSQTEEEQHNASRPAMKEQDTTKKSNENDSTNDDVTLAPPQSLLLPSSFNATLKSALNSYHNSHTLIKSQNNPPTPMPPPFLSHAEECTIKTALAFVIAKARMGKKSLKNDMSCSSNNMEAGNESFLNGRGGNGVVLGSTSGRVGSVLSSHRIGNTPNQSRAFADKSPILGGLLSAPPSSRRITPSVPSHSSNTANNNLAVERKLDHVRDVLKLAVSAVLPLYRGALEPKEGVGADKGMSSATAQSCESKDDDDDDATTLEQSAPQSRGEDVPTNDNAAVRRPCAVYDYEAAVDPSTVVHNNTSLPRSTSSESSSRHATLDGLCQHAIMRLSALIRDEALESRAGTSRVHCGGRTASTVSTATKGGEENDDNASNANGSPTVVTDKSQESRNKLQKGSSSVRDAIMKLIYNDLIGDAYHHGSSYTSSSHTRRSNSSSDIVRECAEHRIEKIMAVCHVLHRLLFLDKTSLLGTEFVVVVCSILSELYSNQYCGRLAMDGDVEGDEDDGDSKSNGSSSNSNGKKQRRHTTNTNKLPVNKEKYQVVSSRWGGDTSSTSSVSTHINDRHERRCQSVDILSQRRYSGVKRGSQIIQKSVEDEEMGTQQKKQLPLPRIGDVLAVNLLRLLEGAAAIRLHHRQQRHAAASSYPSPHSASRRHTYHRPPRSSTRNNDSYMLQKVASMAATEVLSEIRSNVNDELIVPFMNEDAATFYFNEKMLLSHSKSRHTVLLHPGGKIMMRLHLFNLLNKLSLYEQQV